jgi:putative flippase GtrA
MGTAVFAKSQLAMKYGAFALIASAANIIAQDLFIRAYSGDFAILLSISAGTVVGLVVKYTLDKLYIFRFRARSFTHDTWTFVLYASMGLVTTLIFWGFEFAFHHIFTTKEMRYLGGMIGLLLGYLTKYSLDKRYVFMSGAS